MPSDDTDWHVIETFALTYNGYDRWPGTPSCGDVANEVAQTFAETGQLPTDLDVLRSSLFFEQRRWRHYGDFPDERAMQYIRALLRGIRSEVERLPPS